jgi:hypothetical protein
VRLGGLFHKLVCSPACLQNFLFSGLRLINFDSTGRQEIYFSFLPVVMLQGVVSQLNSLGGTDQGQESKYGGRRGHRFHPEQQNTVIIFDVNNHRHIYDSYIRISVTKLTGRYCLLINNEEERGEREEREGRVEMEEKSSSLSSLVSSV